MNAKIVCYDETRPAGGEFSKDKPLALLNSFHYFQRARRNGSAITFVAAGAEAERAMEVVKELLEKPVNPAEALLEMVAGKPVSFPVPNKSLDEAVGDHLRAWGLLEAHDQMKADRMQAERESRPKQSYNSAPWKDSHWM
jgi:hypothetical protein